MYFMRILFFLGCLLIIFQSCTEHPVACTDEFVTSAVTVLDPAGEPADSVQIEITNKESGDIYPCDEYLCRKQQTGSYIIMHDGLREEISMISETIIVEGIKEELQFRETFRFRAGKCHIEKIAGPDTVSLSAQ